MRLYIIETSSKKFKNSSNFFIKKYNLLTISALFLPRKFAPTCGISPLWHPCHYDIQWTFSSTWQDFFIHWSKLTFIVYSCLFSQ